MKKIGFSGTLDPITNGHLWVICEARIMADEVTVFISENPTKKPRFPAQRRKCIIEASLAAHNLDRVNVVVVKGDYTARVARQHGIDFLLRGIRNTADFDYENLLQQTNVDVIEGAKTLFVMPPRDLGAVSSSFVKALQGPVGWHWKIRQFVPMPAYQAMILDWLRKEWETLWQYAVADTELIARADHCFAWLSGFESYAAPSRRYHTLEHLVHGLSELNAWAANTDVDAEQLAVMKKAFWFHDAVYGQGHGSDEEASARLWLDSQLGGTDAEAVAALIRATNHLQAVDILHAHKHVLLGADLAILGQSSDIYREYMQAIRAEYANVPDALYRLKRSKALTRFCESANAGRLFMDAYFAERYQERALVNMTEELRLLG